MESIYSIGVDIGTSTTEIIISKLTIQSSLGPSLLPIINIEKKEVIYQSPIYFTPIIEGELIDFHKLQNYIKVAFKESKIKKEEIATVLVIITGETARKGSRNLSVPWYQTFTNSECRLWKQEHKSYPL